MPSPVCSITASSQASSTGASGDDFYDFNLPYGSDSGNDDGLIRHRHSKKRRRKCHIIIAVFAVLVVLIVGLGVSGFMLFNSARNVKNQASTALTLVTGMKDKVTSGDFAALSDDAQQIDSLCATIYYCLTGKVPPSAMKRGEPDPLIPPSFSARR